MYDVVLLSLDEPAGGCGSACSGCGQADSCDDRPRTPVLHAIDALHAAGARAEAVTAHDDREIDEVLTRLDGPPRADGLTWPASDTKTRLIVVTASDSQLRHVLRRMVRRYAPPPSRRPADLRAGRTVPDLPVVGVLPLDPRSTEDLAARLGLARDPASVASVVLGDRTRRLDLLRHDGGAITIDGTLLGAADEHGQAVPWRGRVEVDDTVLSDGEEALLACAVANAGGYVDFGGIPLIVDPNPADGLVEVAVAVAVTVSRPLRRPTTRLEVRRARGRAVSVTPRDGDLPYVEDGVTGTLTRKRSWWIEPAAWSVFE
ncbi:hypothetical protein F4553_004262 [Allocatelliglobosispora scoriae]|uniref:DAGKc domain-containing protein n=1 Tax=Allocatelliglobosispora scoriae TaxID=643052 RepID=A0A841BVE1_9ACTN|nr:hypothetical protein [Allocatelliglobosispora scoriae]MBB5870883.1 hypothetical protein [Allocatelliglobosispora scoriae]